MREARAPHPFRSVPFRSVPAMREARAPHPFRSVPFRSVPAMREARAPACSAFPGRPSGLSRPHGGRRRGVAPQQGGGLRRLCLRRGAARPLGSMTESTASEASELMRCRRQESNLFIPAYHAGAFANRPQRRCPDGIRTRTVPCKAGVLGNALPSGNLSAATRCIRNPSSNPHPFGSRSWAPFPRGPVSRFSGELPICSTGQWSRRESNPHPSRARRGIFPLDDDPGKESARGWNRTSISG